MKLTDILPLEKWREFEIEINSRFGLDGAVVDIHGVRITSHDKRVNQLCQAIRKTKKGITFICATAHQNFAIQAMRTAKPVVGECDAGLAKIITPIFVKGEYIGAIGGCGLLLNGCQIDSFLVHKTTGIDENEIQKLSQNIRTVPDYDVESLTRFLVERVNTIVLDYMNHT